MKAYQTPKYVELTPKTDQAKQKLGANGTRWVLRDKVAKLKYSSLQGPFLVLRSRMGDSILFVQETNDPNYIVNKL